jgi:hypothetical protein
MPMPQTSKEEQTTRVLLKRERRMRRRREVWDLQVYQRRAFVNIAGWEKRDFSTDLQPAYNSAFLV